MKMNVITIYPEDIGVSDQFSEKWLRLIKKFGWEDSQPAWSYLSVVRVILD